MTARREIGKWLNERTSREVDRQTLAELCAAYDELQALVEFSAPHVVASAEAAHMLDGFKRKRHPIDELVERINAVLPNVQVTRRASARSLLTAGLDAAGNPIKEARMIAALYVETDGAYFGLDGVEPWDEAKDARRYTGPMPVVAHPPCQRWGKFWAGQPLWIARTGERKKKGDDGGCFAAALDSVRRVGGVLEHPWGSHAWPHFGLAVPPRSGGWIKADDCGGWTCCVEQGRYGHYARKPTLLYAVGVELPELRWGKSDPIFPQWAIDKYGIEKCKRAGELAFKGGGTNSTPRIHTPLEFRDLLLAIARSVNKASNA